MYLGGSRLFPNQLVNTNRFYSFYYYFLFELWKRLNKSNETVRTTNCSYTDENYNCSFVDLHMNRRTPQLDDNKQNNLPNYEKGNSQYNSSLNCTVTMYTQAWSEHKPKSTPKLTSLGILKFKSISKTSHICWNFALMKGLLFHREEWPGVYLKVEILSQNWIEWTRELETISVEELRF